MGVENEANVPKDGRFSTLYTSVGNAVGGEPRNRLSPTMTVRISASFWDEINRLLARAVELTSEQEQLESKLQLESEK